MKLSKNLYEVYFTGKILVEAMNKEEAENNAVGLITPCCKLHKINGVYLA